MNVSYLLDPIDKPGLLLAMMRFFAGADSQISLEGDLSGYTLEDIESASTSETAYLKRNTTSPRLDFIVAPLTPANIERINRLVQARGGLSHHSPLIHVQIARDGSWVFGGYDNFHRSCVAVSDALPLERLQALKDRHVIRGFEPNPRAQPAVQADGHASGP